MPIPDDSGVDEEMTVSESSHFAAGAEFDAERARLALLESSADPITFDRLARRGIAPGWRCLEIAAGNGSVARWLAERVGRAGCVIATDSDTRFLEAQSLPENVEIRRHDVMRDPLELGRYDLVHSRALIEHVPDPQRALARMAAALRPGGWLVVEAADFLPLRSAAPHHSDSPTFDRVSRVFVDAMLADGLMDLLLAPRLPALLESLGLVAVDSEGDARVHRGGSPLAIALERSVEQVRDRLLDRGRATEHDLATFGRALADPSFSWMAWIRFAAWGRRPPLAA
jgi:SAM-dependent methyltransferase